MKNSKHTPGPWYSHQTTQTDGRYVIYNDLGTIAVTDATMRAENNAHLIAAAPEMLEALQKYIDLITEFKSLTDQDDKRRLIDSQTNHHKEVKLLIAKATGVLP